MREGVPLDLFDACEVPVGDGDRVGDCDLHALLACQRSERGVIDPVLARVRGANVGVEHDQGGVVGAPVTDRHRMADQRAALFSAGSMFVGDMFFPAALMISSFLRSTIVT